MTRIDYSNRIWTAVAHKWRVFRGEELTFEKIIELYEEFPEKATRVLYIPHLLETETERGWVVEGAVESSLITDKGTIKLKTSGS